MHGVGDREQPPAVLDVAEQGGVATQQSLMAEQERASGEESLARERVIEAEQEASRLQGEHEDAKTQLLADRAARWLFYIALAVAALTAIAWIIAVGFNLDVLERVVTVLVIACPHALGLAVPLVVAITTSIGARNGILVRNRLALEAARNINVVVFDKTGTLTYGRPEVVDVLAMDGDDPDRLLAMAAAVAA